MNPVSIWHDLDLKVIAILRGITPGESEAVVAALLEEGFRAIEIPLNSPDAFDSIAMAVKVAEGVGPSLIGAGTVLSVADVEGVAKAGGNLVVSPNIDPDVVNATRRAGMLSFPGVFTATDAHLAVKLGATGLKFFPASLLGAGGISAIAATLPEGTELCAVGGVGPDEFEVYMKAGVSGFGIGSNLYKPGMSTDEVRRRGREMLDTYRRV